MEKVILRSDPESDIVMEFIYGHRKFLVLSAAVRLGIFDEIDSLGQGNWISLKSLVEKCGYDQGVAERFLNVLSGITLLERKKDEDEKKDAAYLYRNAPYVSRYLLRTKPASLIPVVFFSEMTPALFFNFPNILMNGPSDKLSMMMGGRAENGGHDVSPKDVFTMIHRGHNSSDVMKKPIAGTDTGQTKPAVTSLARGGVTGQLPEMTTPGPATFMKLMDCTVDRCIPALVTAFDLSTHRKAVDIGGGSGCLAHHLATVYPDVHVTVFDLPQVVEVSLQQQPEEMKSRVSFIGGNFFKDDYPMADLFIMARVLHDWDEEKDDVLLTKVFNSLTPGGALLVLEKTLHDDKGGPLPALLEDIGMATLSIGHERSGKEYRNLLAKHGFDQIEIKEIQGSNHFDAIYAIKTEQ